MVDRQVVGLRGQDPDDRVSLGAQQFTCANPRCDEQFLRTSSRGRPKDFHSEECRRAAERDLRRIEAKLAHHERQAEQLRVRAGAYLRTQGEGRTATGEPSDEQLQAAREAIAEVRGMARFLQGHQDEFARDLLKLFEAVAPLANRGQG